MRIKGKSFCSFSVRLTHAVRVLQSCNSSLATMAHLRRDLKRKNEDIDLDNYRQEKIFISQTMVRMLEMSNFSRAPCACLGPFETLRFHGPSFFFFFRACTPSRARVPWHRASMRVARCEALFLAFETVAPWLFCADAFAWRALHPCRQTSCASCAWPPERI